MENCQSSLSVKWAHIQQLSWLFLPECGCSCLTQQVCFPHGNGLKRQEWSINSSPQDLVRDLRRKNRQRLSREGDQLFLSLQNLGLQFSLEGQKQMKVKSTTRHEVVSFPTPRVRHPSYIVALLICQLLSASFLRMWVIWRQLAFGVELHPVSPWHSFYQCPNFMPSWPIDFLLKVSSW